MSNNSCDEVLNFRQDELAETSDLVKAQGVIGLTVALTLYPLCWIVFLYYRRKTHAERLTKRNFPMIFLMSLALTMLAIHISIINFVGNENIDCHVAIFVGSSTFIFTVLPLIMRVFAFVCRIKFNQVFITAKIELLADNGYVIPGRARTATQLSSGATSEESEKVTCLQLKNLIMKLFCWTKPESIPERLQFLFFLSSTRFSIVVTALFGALFFQLITSSTYENVLPKDFECNGCYIEGSDDFIYVTIFMFVVACILLCYLRPYPDSLGVKQEIYVFFSIIVFFHTFFIEIPVAAIDALGDAERDRTFDFSFFIIFEGLAVVFHQLPYQVILAFREKKATSSGNSLKDFIKDEKNTLAYLLYLSTCLGTPNLLFVKAALAWEEDYDKMDERQRRKRCRDISAQFLVSNSMNRINIDGQILSDFVEEIEADRLTKTMFSLVVTELLGLMQPSFKSFQNTSYYAALDYRIVGEDGQTMDLEA